MFLLMIQLNTVNLYQNMRWGIDETTFMKNTLKQKKNLTERELLADFYFSVIEKNLFNDNENSYFFFI